MVHLKLNPYLLHLSQEKKHKLLMFSIGFKSNLILLNLFGFGGFVGIVAHVHTTGTSIPGPTSPEVCQTDTIKLLRLQATRFETEMPDFSVR